MRVFASVPVLFCLLVGLVTDAREGRAVAPLGPEFDGVDVKNKLGEQIDKSSPFTDPAGKTVTLADYLRADAPVILTLNFYRCTSICSTQLNELVTSLVQAGWSPGREKFRIVTVSFDPRDTVEIAAGKQATYRAELVRQLAEADDESLSESDIAARAERVDWTFLVARDKSIRAILDNVGYQVKFDQRTEQFAHSPVVYVLTPEGRIARYLWGISVPARDLKFALMESSDGTLGSFGDKLLLSCFDYNRDHGGYGAFAWGFMRIGGGIVLVLLSTFLLLHWRRERRRAAAQRLVDALTTTEGSPSGLRSPHPHSPSESRS